MNSSSVLILGMSVGLLLSACGQNDTAAPASRPDKEQIAVLTRALFEPKDPAGFQSAIKAARAGSISEQSILEARFLFLIDQRDDAGIAGMVPDLLAQEDNFKVEDSAIFGFKEEWLAVIQFAKALAALQKNDQAGFKSYITEAYWLSPRQASVFTPYIEELRLQEEMNKVRIDFQQVFLEQDSTNKTSLQTICGDAGHILLHFWSPWAQECVASTDDFTATTNELAKNKVPVVAILAEASPDILPEATAFRADLAPNTAATWLIDDPKQPLARLLRIADLPTVALLDTSGSVLFNGHPSDPKLWNRLQQVAPNLVRPTVQPATPSPDQTPSE